MGQMIERIIPILALTSAGMLALPSDAQTFTQLYDFSGRGSPGYPMGPLLYKEGILYGTSEYGGPGKKSFGTVYTYNISQGSAAVLHAFKNPADGQSPLQGVVSVKGHLFGTTSTSGAYDVGTVFKMSRHTGYETPLFSFPEGDYHPDPGGLVYGNGVLYGVTAYGGSANSGTIFTVDPVTGQTNTIYTFQGGAAGTLASSRLVYFGDVLYGELRFAKGDGSPKLFKFDPATGTETVLYRPGGEALPGGILTSHGRYLYGINGNNGGTIFRIDPQTNSYKRLCVLAGAGVSFYGYPVTYLNGSLYGLTPNGGTSGYGAIFSCNLSTGLLSTAYSFPIDSFGVGGELTAVGDTLYGTNSEGGKDYAGILYSFTP
jgi:uncharacterized repeat protein (TIGR03803 family)